jgi:hypothetical protein
MLNDLENIEQKYNLLNEQIFKISSIIEDESHKNKDKTKIDEEIINVEKRIKNMFTEEREVIL